MLAHHNPVYPDYFADPFVLRIGNDYYAYGTGSHIDHGRQPDGRFLPILHSTDLLQWKPLGGAVAPLPGKVDYWAPEVAQRNGHFYLYYSAGADDGMSHRLRVAVADHPAGPFIDASFELMPDIGFSIDAHPFHDPISGRWFLYFARDYFDARVGTGTAVVELADDMLSVQGEIHTVLRATADWQIYQRNRFLYDRQWEAWHTVEGPFVIYRPENNLYYCFYSGGLWMAENYGVSYGTATSPTGPFAHPEGDGPIILAGLPGKLLSPGHCSITTSPDNLDYMIYHAWDPAHTARRMCIDRLGWTTQGPRCEGPTA